MLDALRLLSELPSSFLSVEIRAQDESYAGPPITFLFEQSVSSMLPRKFGNRGNSLLLSIGSPLQEHIGHEDCEVKPGLSLCNFRGFLTMVLPVAHTCLAKCLHLLCGVGFRSLRVWNTEAPVLVARHFREWAFNYVLNWSHFSTFLWFSRLDHWCLHQSP